MAGPAPTDPTTVAAGTLRLDGYAGRIAVVTGAGRGIGAQIATLFAAQGCRVVALDRDCSAAPGELAIAGDVSDPTWVADAFRRVRSELGDPAILVNNAGIYRQVAFEDLSLEEWDRTMAVNLRAAFLTSREVLPGMRQAGYGRLLAISSTAGKTGGWSPAGAYAASKAGLMGLAKTLAREYAPNGITSNVIAPTNIDTPMISPPAGFGATIPVGRLGTPMDVATMALYLCSAHAGYITGEVIDLAGGTFID